MVWNHVQKLLGLSPVTAACTGLVIVLGILYLHFKKRSMPPGPTGLPFVGYWPLLKSEGTHIQLDDLKNKYGDVYSIKIAGQLYIHIGSIKALKEAHITKADCFEERSNLFSFGLLVFGEGIIAANGEKWKSLRKFFMQAFREYGITAAKGYMSGPIYDSVNACVETLKATNGSLVNIIPILNGSTGEIFRRMMFNDDEIKDEELKGVLESYQKVMSIFEGRAILLAGNLAKYFIFPMMKGYKIALENHQKMVDYLRAMVRRHEESYSDDNIRDVIDSYIRERNERRKKGDPSAEYFSESILVYSLTQIVGDGVLGIALFIAHFFEFLLKYPEEQDKIYKELVDVVGEDRQVTLEDRNKLPYTNAFMQEVIRKTDTFTLVPSLMCTKETTLNGHKIPKGAVTVYNLWSCHHDPATFDDPDEFKPSRYLSEPGKRKAEAPVSFGVGKRSCAGEGFAMSQVFVFLTAIMKNFRLQTPDGTVKENIFDGVMEVCAHARK